MTYGFWGKRLRIDLTSKVIKVENVEEKIMKELLGGRNIAARTLINEISAEADPLGPENKLVIATSVLTGTSFPGSSRFTVAAKSPLTGGFGESQAGGWWGPELKFAGYDYIIIEGKAEIPSYIFIKDDHVEIADGRDLWGKETGDVEQSIRNIHNDNKIRVLQTGIAGEKLVKYAAITNELKHWCGRGGLGAVMGSKNLRAVAVRGSKKVNIYDNQAVMNFAKQFSSNMKLNKGLSNKAIYGTAGGVVPLNEVGLLPTENFRKGSFDKAEEISGTKMYDDLLKKREGCYACPVRCKRVVEYLDESLTIDAKYGGPEFETIGSLGSVCGVGDLKVVCKANELCGKYGLDTISTGVTIAFAMECYEKGLINKSDTEGMELTFGNGEAVLIMIERIAKRQGFGDLLAEGSYRAAQKIGKGSIKYSMTSKKQEFPSHEPRGKWGVGLGYAVSPTGADHLVAAHDPWFENKPDVENQFTYMDIIPMYEFGIRDTVPSASLGDEKIRLFTHLQYLWSLYDVLDLCIFVGVPEYRMITIRQIVEQINYITGWDLSFWEIIKAGEKGITLARLFNIKHGITNEDDYLPERLFEPLENGAHQGYSIDRSEFENALMRYYEIMGWDDSGKPQKGKLIELGLYEMIEKLN